MLVEISEELYQELDKFYGHCWMLNQLDGARMPLIRLLDLIGAVRPDGPTLTLPGPDGYPNEQVPQKGWLD